MANCTNEPGVTHSAEGGGREGAGTISTPLWAGTGKTISAGAPADPQRSQDKVPAQRLPGLSLQDILCRNANPFPKFLPKVSDTSQSAEHPKGFLIATRMKHL